MVRLIPSFRNIVKLMGYPSCSEIPMVMTLLGDPMGVMLPPRFAPIASPHQRSLEDSSTTKFLTMGDRDEERGMLSTTEEAIPESHIRFMEA